MKAIGYFSYSQQSSSICVTIICYSNIEHVYNASNKLPDLEDYLFMCHVQSNMELSIDCYIGELVQTTLRNMNIFYF